MVFWQAGEENSWNLFLAADLLSFAAVFKLFSNAKH